MPHGFQFHPTDEEICMYYLKRKVTRKHFLCDIIPELDVYQFEPCDLSSMAPMTTRDLCYYFFVPRSHKYSHGSRTNRSTHAGYWKATGVDRKVEHGPRTIGKIRTLVFYTGKAPKGERTDWVMHEYRLEDAELAAKGVSQEAYVVAKVYKKSGAGPKNGEQYGAPFVEEEWEEHDCAAMTKTISPDVSQCTTSSGLTMMPCVAIPDQVSGSTVTPCSIQLSGPTVTTPDLMPSQPAVTTVEQLLGPAAVTALEQMLGPALTPTVGEQDELDRMLFMFTADEGTATAREEDVYHKLPDLLPDWASFNDRDDDINWAQFHGRDDEICMNLEELDDILNS